MVRIQWLGNKLREDGSSIIKQFIIAKVDRYLGDEDGHIFNYISRFNISMEWVSFANDAEKWKEITGRT